MSDFGKLYHEIGEGTMIKFEDVYKSFGKDKPILQGINLTLKKGEILCLLGPSGCGKSTMVNLMMGNLVPDKGHVKMMGEEAPYKRVRSSFGYMPQNSALYEDITARENLLFFGQMNGLSKREVKEKMPDLLSLAGLEACANQLVSTFSGGMKRRLSLAVALLHDPDLLILDEPTVGLDPVLRKQIWDQFEKMAKEGKTILITTHIMDEAERCKRIAMLYGGYIIADDAPSVIVEKTKASCLEEAFLYLEKGGTYHA